MPKIRKSKSLDKHQKTWKEEKPASTIKEIVFANFNSLWWPGVVIDGTLCGQQRSNENYEWVYWYEDRRISFVPHSKICSFRSLFSKVFDKKVSKKCNSGIEEALQDVAVQDGFLERNIEKLIQWGLNGFPSHGKERVLCYSKKVGQDLEVIKSLSVDQKKSHAEKKLAKGEKDNTKNEKLLKDDLPEESQPSGSASNLGNEDSCDNYLNPLNLLRTVCISCRKSSKRVSKQHPLFHGGICDECEDCLLRYIFALDEDGFMVVCVVCGNAGELLICDVPGCRRVYCSTCIVDLISEDVLNKFRRENPWSCLMCRDFDEIPDGLLIPREDWWENVTKAFSSSSSAPPLTNITLKLNRGIRVLSLYDGISAGYYALSKLGITIDKYYACEIDPKAIIVSKFNFPNKISYVGDIECLTAEKIAELGPIDLVIGGSPCNDLSAVNPARKGLYANDGTGRLFFEFYRVLKTVQEQAVGRDNPVFWMYENVASMPAKYREIISRFLECQPALINAKDFSAQHRPRFFWSSIPGINQLSGLETNDCPTLSSTLPSGGMRVANVQKINTVTTQKNSLKTGKNHPVLMDGELTGIWITELEVVFGFPPHFTDVCNLSVQQRLNLLGKSWSVAVIKNIFSPLRHIFATKN